MLYFDLTGCAPVNGHDDTLDDDIDFLSAMNDDMDGNKSDEVKVSVKSVFQANLICFIILVCLFLLMNIWYMKTRANSTPIINTGNDNNTGLFIFYCFGKLRTSLVTMVSSGCYVFCSSFCM